MAKHVDHLPADLLTPAIIAAGPAVVALFIAYVETANAANHRKATKVQVQAAYHAYDRAFAAAWCAAAQVAPTDDDLLEASAAAHEAFLDAVDAAAPLETDPDDPDDPPPSGGSQGAPDDEDETLCCWCYARPGTVEHLAGWFCSDACFDACAEVGRDLVLGRRSWIVSAADDDELAAYEGWQSSADDR
jgi:hypothetical protein